MIYEFCEREESERKRIKKTSFIGQIQLASTKVFENISSLNYFLLVGKLEVRPRRLLPRAFLIRVTVRVKRGPCIRITRGNVLTVCSRVTIVARVNKKFPHSLLLTFYCKLFDRRTLEPDVRFSPFEVKIGGGGRRNEKN